MATAQSNTHAMAPLPRRVHSSRQHAAWGLHSSSLMCTSRQPPGPGPARPYPAQRSVHLSWAQPPGPWPQRAPAPSQGGSSREREPGPAAAPPPPARLLASRGCGTVSASCSSASSCSRPDALVLGAEGPLPDLGGVTSSSGCPSGSSSPSSSGSQSSPSRPSRVASSSRTSSGGRERHTRSRVGPSQDGQSGAGRKMETGVGGYLLSRWAQCRAAQSCQRSRKGCRDVLGPQGSLPRPEFSWSLSGSSGGHGVEERPGRPAGPQWGPPVGRKLSRLPGHLPPKASEQGWRQRLVGEQGGAGAGSMSTLLNPCPGRPQPDALSRRRTGTVPPAPENVLPLWAQQEPGTAGCFRLSM